MKSNYHLTLRLPAGLQKGTLTLIEQNGTLRGTVSAVGLTSRFKNGKINGNSFEFTGHLYTALFRLRYKADGTFDGDAIHLTATTNFGVYQISGAKAE